MRNPKQVGYAVHTISGWLLITLIGFLVFSSTPSHASTAEKEPTPTTQTTSDEKTFTPEQEQNRREFKAMLWASIIILTGLFLMVFILFIFRMARAVRRLQNVREKKKHTEVIDAWSNYRLPDDATQDFSD